MFNNCTTTIGDIALKCLKPGSKEETLFNTAVDVWVKTAECFPHMVASGRSSYIGIQELICMASAHKLKYGGQGLKAPDFWFGSKWGETKSFVPGKTKTHVAASRFFAKNSSSEKHRKLHEEVSPEAAKKFLFEHSYDKNDIYCLTGTGKDKNRKPANPKDIELIFVEKELLISCLIQRPDKGNLKEVDLDILRSKISKLKT